MKGHFPKLVDCAHFHYENVDFGSIEVRSCLEQEFLSSLIKCQKGPKYMYGISLLLLLLLYPKEGILELSSQEHNYDALKCCLCRD